MTVKKNEKKTFLPYNSIIPLATTDDRRNEIVNNLNDEYRKSFTSNGGDLISSLLLMVQNHPYRLIGPKPQAGKVINYIYIYISLKF